MKRVTSRQRLAYDNAFEAAVIDEEESDYETCCNEEVVMSRPSSFSSLSLALDRSASMESFSHYIDTAAPRRKRIRDDLHPSALVKKNVSFSNLKLQTPSDAPLPQVIPAFDFEINSSTNQDSTSLLDLMDDVMLHLISFLTPSDARALSTTCQDLGHLLFSREGHHLWKSWCYYQWPMLTSMENGIFVDDFSLPTALASGSSDASLGPNLSLLLGMASDTQPTKIDEALFSAIRHFRLPRWNHQDSTSEKTTQFRSFLMHDLPVVQFTGAVGTGDRCIRSDQPLSRPRLVQAPPTNNKWAFPPKYMEGGMMLPHGKHSILDMIRGYSHFASTGWWRPFVSPFVTRDKAGGPLEVHLTPRMVSYFEVSLLERDESSEPAMDRPDETPTYAGDCVAVGVSSGVFHLHSKMPGWDSFSYGYHGDDGGIFHASGEMVRRFGPRYGPGDTVGCGIDYVCRGIFFTLNGEFLGYAWTDICPEFLKHHELYPTIGVDTNCPVACNFGGRPFEFDLTPLVKSHEEIVERSLSTIHSAEQPLSLPPSQQGPKFRNIHA